MDGDRDISTRTSVVPNESYTAFDFIWSAKDTVGIYPDAGSQVFFTMENGAGASSATFDGGAWTCKDGYVYRSYYPFIGDIYLDATKIPVTFLGQKQVGNDNSDHFQKYDYMYTAAATLTLSLDEALFVTEGEYDLTAASPAIVGKKYSDSMSIDLDVTFTSPDILKVYVPLAPMDMSGKTLTITITDDNGREFQYTYNPSKPYDASKIYRLKSASSLVQPNNVIYYTSTDGNVVIPNATDVFGANIVSYDYVNGQGVITFDGDVTSIGTGAFSNRKTLSSVSIPNSVTSIGQIAFMDCSSLQEINIPESVVEIGTSAFIRCSSLSSTIIIPNSVTNLGDKAFAGCVSLSRFSGKYSADNGRCLIRDNTIIAIAPYGLTSYSIPTGVTGIEYAFSGCDTYSILIPNTVETIGHDAFYDCENLSTIDIPESVICIGYQSFTGSGLVSIYIPSNVKKIDGHAFEICRNLESVTIEEGVTSIGSRAFYNCFSLSSIILPESVNKIYSEAFGNCTSLSSITIKAINPPSFASGTNNDAFYNTNCPIYVPKESVESYKTAWTYYADRIQAIPTTGEINGHAYVDMGNGLLWATMNIGASSPEDIGDYFAWGETEPYYNSKSPLTWKVDKSSGYCWESYQFNPSGDGATFSKYTDEYTGESVLLSEDDAARVNWGGLWRIPNYYDWIWLKSNCTWQYETNSGVSGYRVTSKINSHSFFLPVAGYFAGTTLYSSYSGVGFYWSSSMGNVGNTPVARGLYLTSNEASFRDDYRYRGQSIRPVSD